MKIGKKIHSSGSVIVESAILMLIDAVLVGFSVFASLLLLTTDAFAAFDFKSLIGIPIIVIVYLVVYYLAQLHRVVWAYAGIKDIVKHGVVMTFAWLVFFAIHVATGHAFPNKSVYFVGLVLSELFVLLVRFIMRAWSRLKGNIGTDKVENPVTDKKENPVMVIGGGNAAYMLIHDLKNNMALPDRNVVCIIDDKPSKMGRVIYGVPVVGDCNDIGEKADEYGIKTIIFAIPSCPKQRMTEILNVCSNTGRTVKVLPTLYSENGDYAVDATKLRRIEINDLLDRDPITADTTAIGEFIAGKTVLVTGGGGSIGSELSRQICSFKPKKLIIFDIYENNAYDIRNELKRNYPDQPIEVLIGSVRDKDRVEQVFEKYRPELVFHAAAHKHVPLMEDSPNESIKNNVFGTYNVAEAADKYGVKRFVLISTDKAVNPTNIMGASKRICEMIIQTFNNRSKTEFVAVRFGNVLGSNGSVVPLFKEQIERGGPVTVTHPDIIRYFMTIPEAVLLVLQAGTFAKGGEIFILDMGKPVKIVELAEKVIRLSGYEPYKDIKIIFTGLRPGEKLYEELLIAEEGIGETANKMIFIGKPIAFDEKKLTDGLNGLKELMKDDKADIRSAVMELVPTYAPKIPVEQ